MAVTPLSGGELLVSHTLARYIIALVQIGILVVSGMIIFGTKISIYSLLLPVVILVGNTIFLNIGFIISSLTRDYEQAAPYTMVVGTVLMFLGDAFFPLQNVPRPLQQIAEYLPMKPLVSAFRYSILGVRSADFWREILVLVAWFVILTLAAKYVFEKKAYK